MTALAALPRWDLTPYFPSLDSSEFSAAMSQFAAGIMELESSFDSAALDSRNGSETDAVPLFDSLLSKFNVLLEQGRLIGSYVGCNVTTDTRNELALRKESELDQLQVRVRKLGTRFSAWIGKHDISAWPSASNLAAAHAFWLEKSAEQAKHQMAGSEEALAADLSSTGSTAWAKLHGQVTSQLSVKVAIGGSERTMGMASVRNLAYDPDRNVRAAAYEAEQQAWKANETVIALALNSIKGEFGLLCQKRGWGSALDHSLYTANIDRQTLDAMMQAAHESFPAFRRYMKAKAQLLGIGDRLAWYDIFAPISSSEEASWGYDRACDFVTDCFASYSDKMADFAKRNFAENWVDAEPRDGKEDGAYCTSTRNGESRIFMNYKPAFGSVSTLAQELGHGYHNLCLKDRTPTQKFTPMTLAETASIFCETIIRRAGMQNGTPAERLTILEAAIQGYNQVVVDITSRYLFESAVFEQRPSRELSARELCDLMLDAQRKTYGDGLLQDKLHPYMWAVKPHYYSGSRAFYNYPYMFGLLFGTGLYAIYEKEPDSFKANYDDLLSATGMFDAATLASRFGFDIRTPDFWRDSLKVIEAEIDEFVRIAGEMSN